jgi:hypothetical protein
MQIIGFLGNDTIDEVLSVSDNYMLFYLNIDSLEDDIRAMNHSKYGTFFNYQTGEVVSIENALNYQLVDQNGKVIFSSQNKIENSDLVIRYGIIQQTLSNNLSFN